MSRTPLAAALAAACLLAACKPSSKTKTHTAAITSPNGGKTGTTPC